MAALAPASPPAAPGPRQRASRSANAQVQNLLLKLLELRKQDDEIDVQLTHLLQERDHIRGSIDSLRHSASHISAAEAEARKMSTQIQSADRLATGVSRQVRELDTAQSRLKSTLERVELISDIKETVEFSREAIKKKNYEEAAMNINRVLSFYRKRKTSARWENASYNEKQVDAHETTAIHSEVLTNVGDDDDEESISFKVLIDIESELREIVVNECKQARESDPPDNERIKRFCKIYAFLGLAKEGLVIFCDVIGDNLLRYLRKNSLTLETRLEGEVIPYLDIMESVFNTIDDTINEHASTVCSFYGPGSHLRLVQKMQHIADAVLAPCLEDLMKTRKLKQIASRAGKLSRNFDRFGLESQAAIPEAKFPSLPVSGDTALDPRHLDDTAEELVSICREIEWFDSDLRELAENASETMKSENESMWKSMASDDSVGIKLAHVSKLNEAAQEILGYYVAFEQFCMLSNVNKAVCLDMQREAGSHSQPESSASEENDEKESHMVDDIFYLLKKTSERSFQTHSYSSACAILNYISCSLSGPYHRVLSNRLVNAQRLHNENASLLFTDAKTSRANLKKKVSALNNIEISVKNSQMLKDHLALLYEETFSKGGGASIVKHSLSELGDASKKLRDLLHSGLRELCNSLQPTISPYIEEFGAVSYELNDEQYSLNEAKDPFVEQLTLALEHEFTPYHDLTRSNFDAFVLNVSISVARQVESMIFKKRFTFSGGLQIDKDVRRLISFFSKLCNKSFRDKFARLSQIASVLQLYEVSEMVEYWGDGSEHWRLNSDQVKQVMRLRVDFSPDAIQKLQL